MLVVALICTAVAVALWRRRTAPGGRALIVYMIATAWWSGTYALFWANFAPSRQFWLNATYLGVVALSPALLVFTLQFTHREKWLTSPVWALLIIEPILTILILLTDSWHGLFFGNTQNTVDSSIFAGGPWFWVNVVFAYSLSLFVIILLIRSFFASQGLYRRQILPVLLATSIPWVSNIVSFANLNPWPALDLTPIAFSLSGTLIAINLFLYRFLDVVPVARDKLVENMKDSILVVDKQNRVVDVNPALTRLLNLEISAIIGQKVEAILPEWSQLQATSEDDRTIEQEIQIPNSSAEYLNIRVISLQDSRGKEQGKLIILRNITARKKMETEREELINRLQTTLGEVKTLSGLLPICANCKKIRDDQGYWQDVAVYVRDHSEAEFTHGMCPECMEAYYPGAIAQQS
ncbi:MAG: PAS domain-containing protein [Chloroflexi bacterium]|nr:PAS domain-containing protein [Chloroflexota bacterium]